jgi:prepilin-type N-terminal cleavage/methylation domain-containing protein
MKIKIKNKAAFSFIELIIVISIISIMAVVLLVNQRTNVQPKDEVDTAARELVALIREQQNNAINGQQINISGTMTSVCGMGATWVYNTAPTVVQTFYQLTDSNPSSTTLCVSSGTNYPGTPYGSIPPFKNVIITTPASTGYVFFKVPFAGMTSDATPEQIVLTSTVNLNVHHTICVYANTVSDAEGNKGC